MRYYHRGDTIIELVVAFAIFSLAAVGTIAILNKGIAATQRNLEATLVRQQVDAQAELLRYIHDTQNPLWASLVSSAMITTNPAPISTNSQSCPKTSDASLSRGFYVKPTIQPDPKNTTFGVQAVNASSYRPDPQTYAKIDYQSGASISEGIWIQVAEAQNDAATSIKAYDFYIHACWTSVGLDAPMTLGTIVRLYEQ